MKKQSLALMIVAMSALLVLCAGIAGCTSQTPVTVQKLSTIEPSEMALGSSDVPEGFVLVEKYERNISDMRDWAVDKGWKRGYGTYFATSGKNAQGIDQVISLYPAENITLILPDTVQSIKNWSAIEKNITIEELPRPAVGDSSRALKISEKDDPVDLYMIAFVKYDVYEELYINGTRADYQTLIWVADTAATKIR